MLHGPDEKLFSLLDSYVVADADVNFLDRITDKAVASVRPKRNIMANKSLTLGLAVFIAIAGFCMGAMPVGVNGKLYSENSLMSEFSNQIFGAMELKEVSL